MTRYTRSLSLPLAFAGAIALASLPALAADTEIPSLKDGRVHGFSGCLTQEPTGTRYFDLTGAKSDDGKSLGTVRLTSSVWGIQPKQSLNQEVHVNGIYFGRLQGDPGSGHIRVKDAWMLGAKCS